jgi:predicted alpha/beta superfamily hydrolase
VRESLVAVYMTETVLQRELDVHFPAGKGRVVLRTELDWDRDVEPVAVSKDGSTSSFRLEARKPYLYLKPCLKPGDGSLRWAVGSNALALMTAEGTGHLYPYFEGPESGSFTALLEKDSTFLGRKLFVRLYLPPGYEENPLRRYPVLYMQDGKNLFFPQEAFLGHEWKVDVAVSLLDRMNAMDRVVVVGVYSGDRMEEYTRPGYEAYARAVVEEVKPAIEGKLRVFESARETGVVGSSLGGVVSFYMAWEYPQVFGYAACMSSTFSYKDDLIDRVLSEPKRESKFYLDSGWPGDNFEVTLAMAMALQRRGYRARQDFLHLVFPADRHDETAWGRRLNLPLQLGLGKLAAASRGRQI